MCSEAYMPEVTRALALRGAELIFMPAGTDKRRLWASWRNLIWSRAIENLAIVVTTQNLFSHAERGLAMVATPEEILFESTAAGFLSSMSVSTARAKCGDHRFRHLRAQLRRKAGRAWPAMAAAGTARGHVSAPARRSRGVSIARRQRPCEFARRMSPRPDLGPKPRLGYSESRIERAAELRTDAAAIDALARKPGAGAYVIGGEGIVMKKGSPLNEPLFTLDEAQALIPATETVFLGLLDGAPRFGMGSTPQAAEALKSRERFASSPICGRSRCKGLVEPDHLPPIAEAKAVLHWHARHRFCSNCGAVTRSSMGDGGATARNARPSTFRAPTRL